MVKSSIGKSNDKIQDLTMSVSRNFKIMSEITTGKEVKPDCLSVDDVIGMDIEVASDDKFVRCGGCMGIG